MAPFHIVAIYIIVHVSLQAVAFGDPKTGPSLQLDEDGQNTTNVIEMKKGSRLRMYKTSSGVALNSVRNETLRRARDLVLGTPTVNFRDISKNGHISEFSPHFIYETNAAPYAVSESPSQLPDSYGSNGDAVKKEDSTAESYYYNDFGDFVKDADPNTEQTWSVNGVTDPKYIRIPPSHQHSHRRSPPKIEGNSCKQYLEFLRYAFEQIDNTAKKHQNDHRDDYYYDDDVYSEEEYRTFNTKTYGTKPPPLLIPDMAKLRNLTYSDNYGTESTYSYVQNGFINNSESTVTKTPETSRRTPQSTSAPVTSEITRPDTERFSSSTTNAASSGPVDNMGSSTASYEIRFVPVTNMSATTVDDSGYRVGVANATAHAEEVEGARQDGCHDRMFPCPDNINVTYPVNGYCNRFVVCESGKPNPQFCHEGLHFNLITLQCDLPHNSFCTYSCPRENGYFGVPGVCGGFFRCQDWYPEFRMCPPRMHWDLKAKICTFQELSSCPLKCEKPYEARPYNGDCSSYIICTRGKPTYHRCPDSMDFDRNLLKCLPKTLSNCSDDEDYIARNRGIENGRKQLCAKVELEDGKSKWCQETAEDK